MLLMAAAAGAFAEADRLLAAAVAAERHFAAAASLLAFGAAEDAFQRCRGAEEPAKKRC
jgi:hypothetical protein